MPKLTSVNRPEIDRILRETDPRVLHTLATEYVQEIKKIYPSLDQPEDAASLFQIALTAAAFCEARAVYFRLVEDKRDQEEEQERKSRQGAARARFR